MTSTANGQRLDTLGLFEEVLGTPERVAAVADSASLVDGLPGHDAIAQVVLLGAGDSALAGELIAAVAGPFMAVPVIVDRGHELPSFVGPETFVIALSSTGTTEDTVEAASAAVEAGAHLLAVTRPDGRLAEVAGSWGSAVVHLPSDTHPRTAFLPLAVIPLLALEQLGFYPGAREWISEAVDQLVVRRDQLASAASPAREIARAIDRTIPVIYGGGPLGAVAALRWKQQLNVSAKIPAFCNTVPELVHNEIAGWGQHGDVTRQVFTQIDLRHDHEHPSVSEQFAIVDELTLEVVVDIVRVDAAGDGPLAQLLDLVLIGDVVALELAAREGVDPGPVPAVEAARAVVRR